jgi:hypothetical protein
MEVNIFLSCEEGSALFSERSFTLADGGQVGVARAGGQDHPGDDNAVLMTSKEFLSFLLLLIRHARFVPDLQTKSWCS